MHVTQPNTFGVPGRAVRTWYWALPSRELRRGQATSVRLLGRGLVLFRGESGAVKALDAYCPHMGAHLAQGKVEGDDLRCFFHGWKLDGEGVVRDVPCQGRVPDARVASYPVEERYGLVWVWPGSTATHPVPFVPELQGIEMAARVGRPFSRACHPNVTMINAIDEQHFRTVHNMAVEPKFEVAARGAHAQTFRNSTLPPARGVLGRLLRRFYAGRVTYDMCYWGGTNGFVTVGPDALHCYILFALRPTEDGGTEGQTILLQPRRTSFAGRVVQAIALRATQLVANYFAKGDSQVFEKIRFELKTPIAADRSIVAFMRFVEGLESVAIGDWGGTPSECSGRPHPEPTLVSLRSAR